MMNAYINIPNVILPWLRNRTGTDWGRVGFMSAVSTFFEGIGCKVELQPYKVADEYHYNIIASLAPDGYVVNPPLVVFQAHYDTVRRTPGGDDNWSGCLGVLTAAFVAAAARQRQKAFQFVLTDTEEPPYFGTCDMGSYVHAESLEQTVGLEAVEGVISFDCIGFYTPEVGWKDIFYGNAKTLAVVSDHPDHGLFASILLHGKSSRQLADRIALFHDSDMLTPIGNVTGSPEVYVTDLSGTDHEGIARMSDHASYRDIGFPAVQINDMALSRPGSMMHLPGDDLTHIDIEKIQALAATVAASMLY